MCAKGCNVIVIYRHLAIWGDVCAILGLYKEDLRANRVQIGVMLVYLEQSWHAKRQTLNLTLNTLHPTPYSIAGSAYKTCVFSMFLKIFEKLSIFNIKHNFRSSKAST